MGTRLSVALIAAVALALAAAPAASADTSLSSNWAGYAVHKSGVQFDRVAAVWREPNLTCAPGSGSFSALWVGLGGFSLSSQALEQIGTEEDCSRAGNVESSAWYELVPAPASTIRMPVAPGDLIRATVTVTGHRVLVSLDDQSRHRRFSKQLQAASVDVSSAEWIVEAPSDCLTASFCRTLPLANFGSATFALADAQSAAGHSGSISSRSWGSTRLDLVTSGRRFVSNQGTGASLGAASTSALTDRGKSFTVTFSQLPIATTTAQSFARRAVGRRPAAAGHS
jgi:hypothetical protein